MKKLIASLALAASLATPSFASGPIASIPPGWSTYTKGYIKPNLRQGDVIAFVGDSVTAIGDQPGGWQYMIASDLLKNPTYNKVTIYNAGISGDTIDGVYNRLGSIFALKPTVFVLWIGIHEVNETSSVGTYPNQYFPRGAHGYLSLSTYGWYLNAIIYACKTQKNIREIVILTPMCSGEKWENHNPYDQLIDTMSQTCKDAAWSDQVPQIDIRSYWIAAEYKYNTKDVSQGILTNDGTHPVPYMLGMQLITQWMETGLGVQ
jgi:hypothetical protein